MAHGYAEYVKHFVDADEDSLIGQLIEGVATTGISSHENTQIQAWRDEIRLLKKQLASPAFQDWFIILEYEIPRRSRRPDVILLSETTVFVVELKVGALDYDSASRWQCRSYALDLRDFHEESHGCRIVPILCATEADENVHWEDGWHDSESVMPDVIRTNGLQLQEWLIRCERRAASASISKIEPERWLSSGYRPTPTILEAAVQLYEGHGVREISHRYAQNLDATTDLLVQEIESARRLGRRVICFVTGVPGAGKTLTGLNVVHDPGEQRTKSPVGIFLSGNGPLVNVIRAALVQSQTSQGHTKRDAEREVTTFIQNVHVFLREYHERTAEPPPENVVVFDEAQRAWDSAQMKRKRDIDVSEADLLFDVMERLPDWTVIIALVGGGQEIFLGEAGLEEWGRALSRRSVAWQVVASPEVLTGGDSVAGHRLFEHTVPPKVAFHEEPNAHLDVVVRSHRAHSWARWVNEFLAMRFDAARMIFPDTEEFPCFITRDLAHARSWLRMHHQLVPEERTGLLATSKDARLRAYGIERSSAFLTKYRFDHWFLAPHDDPRSSVSLEVAASEFECQGLELDWIGLCWGGDLVPARNPLQWEYGKFSGNSARWNTVKKESEQVYTLNRYRVLLTRARKGLVIWVPPGDRDDPTRNPERFDRVYDALMQSGIPLLKDNFPVDNLNCGER